MFKRRGTIIAEGLRIKGSVSAEGLVAPQTVTTCALGAVEPSVQFGAT
jgi:hypothetical protein